MSYEVIPTLPEGFEGRESGIFKKNPELASKFSTFDAAADYVVMKLTSSDYPAVDTNFLDAVASWLQPHGTEHAKDILGKVRDKWVTPYAMTRNDDLHQQVLELSDILSDPKHARDVFRSRQLEESARAQVSSATAIPQGENESSGSIVSFDTDDLGASTEPKAAYAYEVFTGEKRRESFSRDEEGAIILTDADLDDAEESSLRQAS